MAEKEKLPDLSASLDCFVIDGDGNLLEKVLEAVGRLRQGGASADFSAKRQNVGKQFKEANRRNARYAIILRADGIGVKNLATGEQTDVSAEEFLKNPSVYMKKQQK
jgi:histidyl-tRNA synthetase